MKRVGITLLLVSLAGCTSPAPRDPDRIPLLRGYQPETVVSGPPGVLYVGTLTGGGIEEVMLATGQTRWLVEPQPIGERVIAGLAYDATREQIVACGAWLSNAFVFDARTGELVSETHFPSGLINAVALRGDEVFFTESIHPVMYRMTRDVAGRFVGEPGSIPLTGDFRVVEGLMDMNSNGILAPEGTSDVIVVHSTRGELYRVDPAGVATRIPLGVDVGGGDGLLFDARGLVVVQNGEPGDARVSFFEVDEAFATGTFIRSTVDPRFRSPTTAARQGESLWVLNSRLLEIFHGVAAANDDFDLVRISLPEVR